VHIRGTERSLPAGQYKVIGPDGKEIKGAKVIVIEPVSGTQSPAGAAIEVISGDSYHQPTVGGLVELARSPAVPGQPGGKPIVLANVVSGTSGQVINLSRATYRLPKEKSAALAAFLKDNVKAAVLEIKLEDSGLTVTTTPEAQAAIGGIARLMAQGQIRSIKIRQGGVEKEIK
jgi:hypothetical protein